MILHVFKNPSIFIVLTFWLLTQSISPFAQIVPDLTIGDHFRPNLSEIEKRNQIVTYHNQQQVKSSQELSTQQGYFQPILGTIPSPGDAFRNNFIIGYSDPSSNSNTSISSILTNNSLSIDQRNLMEIEANMAAYEGQKKHREELIDAAFKELTPDINYHLGTHNGKAVDGYIRAYTEIEAMLTGSVRIDFLKAVWLVESAADPSLSWQEFNNMFNDGLQVIMELMRQDKLSPNDNLAKLMTVFKYMTDTTKVFITTKEKTIVSKPMLYDFDDYEGKNDPTKVFVSKLLRSGTGQCMSLPMLYYLYAKALKADVSLAFAPEHSYITFKDNLDKRQNIELTGRMFTTADFHWQNGFVKAEQVKSGIYLTPISEKQTIAYLLTTLTLTYVKKFGTDNRVFEMASIAKEHFPNSLTANMILLGYSNELWKNVLRQYDVYGLSEDQLRSDKNAQTIKANRDIAYNHVMKNLGYSKMPDWAYQAWLNSVNELANQQQHIIKRRQLEQQLNK